MAEANVTVAIADPDKLMSATTSPYGFAAASIKLYRYTTEALARAATSASPGGTLVTTFTLVASTTAPSDPDIAGPYRFGYYDASQGAGSWYRYFLQDSGGSNLSPMSDPWEADNRPSWALRDILFELGDAMGQSVLKGTAATAVSTSVVDCDALFKTTFGDARFFEGWWLLCSYDAGGAAAAPEGQEARIDSVDISNGQATLEIALTAAVDAGDIILVSAYISFAAMIRAINRARERMSITPWTDIALTKNESRYPAPAGVRANTDILDARFIYSDPATYSNREEESEANIRVDSDGYRTWIYLDGVTVYPPVLRVKTERSYRDHEGALLLMGDTTMAPIEWMRPVACLAVAELLHEEDRENAEFLEMVGKWREEAARASARYAPEITRAIRRKSPTMPGPGGAPW